MATETEQRLLSALEVATATARGDNCDVMNGVLAEISGAPTDPAPPEASPPNDPVMCSFCGTPRAQCFGLVAGPCVFICDVCFMTCAEVFAEQLRLEGGGVHAVAQLQAARARAEIKALAKDGQPQ